jgi:peptidoglycan/LPS O-acetylase OafA/YrhL
VSIVTLGVMLFGIYPNFTSSPLNRVSNILYQSTSRIIWAMALGFIIYSCVINGGISSHNHKYVFPFTLKYFFSFQGIVNKLLSLSFWIPLSRLSFSLYLIHYTVLTFYSATMEKPFHIQDSSIVSFLT